MFKRLATMNFGPWTVACGHAGTLILCFILGLLCAGCSVGPNYHTPKVRVGSRFGEAQEHEATNAAKDFSQPTSQHEPVDAWWRTFGDPQLDGLIDAAVHQNYSLQIAAARIRQARAQRGIVASGLFPEISAGAGYNRARGSKNLALPLGGGGGGDPPGDPPSGADPPAGSAGAGSGGGSAPLTPFGSGGLPGITTQLYQLGFDSSWELDIFGGTRRRIEAAKADIEAAVENSRGVLVSLMAEVARDYLELRGAQRRLAVAHKNLSAERQTLELTQSRHQSGLTSELDVARAAGQVAMTEAALPTLEAQVRVSIHALSILVGREPNELSADLNQAKPLPAIPPQVPVGLPSELLLRRPDLRQAERRLAAATARIGSAKADWFPKFSITGNIGLDSSSLSHLLDWQSHYFLVSPTVSWPIFDAGRIRSNVALQKANQQEALLQYQNSILIALQEVEDALINYTAQQSRQDALREALKQSRQALGIARDQYQHGLADFLTVLDAERSVLEVEDSLAQSNQIVCTDLVALYKALGGGWGTPERASRS